MKATDNMLLVHLLRIGWLCAWPKAGDFCSNGPRRHFLFFSRDLAGMADKIRDDLDKRQPTFPCAV
jgi:hypothetical protein